jgi:O-antigen ligase
MLGKAVLGGVFWTWFAVVAFSQAVFNRDLHPIWRWMLAGVVLLDLYLRLVQDRIWVSGWAPAVVAIGVAWLAGAPRLVPISLIGGGAGGMALLPWLMSFGSNEKSYDLLTRTAAWSILKDIMSIDPILGIGFANYYWYTPLFPILGYNVRFNSHNNYVDILAETGVLGFACFLWFAVALARVGWSLRTRVAHGFARAYVYGALGGLAGTLVSGLLGDWVLPFVYNIGFSGFRSSVLAWVFLGGLVALAEATRRDPGSVQTKETLGADVAADWRNDDARSRYAFSPLPIGSPADSRQRGSAIGQQCDQQSQVSPT